MQLAAALRAEKLILMTDVPGVMKDKDDISTKYTELDIRATRQVPLPEGGGGVHLASNLGFSDWAGHIVLLYCGSSSLSRQVCTTIRVRCNVDSIKPHS